MNNKMKKQLIGFGKFAAWTAGIFLLLYGLFHFVPGIAKYDFFSIGSGSMEPIIMTGDLVVIDSSVNLDDLLPGDIIAVDPGVDVNGDGINDVIVHYLDSVTTVDGVREYRTKPEISDDQDPWILTDEDIIGIYVLKISKVGSFLMFAQSTFGKIVLIADVLVIYALFEIIFADDKKNKNKKENLSVEDESVQEKEEDDKIIT